MKKVSFQGEHGAYSESAVKKFFKEEIETVPCNSFQDTLNITENGGSDYCILPVENSIEGTVGQSIDAITHTKLHAIGEEYFKVEHCLISIGKLEDIETLYSHPQALGQCSDFIQSKKLKTVPTYDTAGSVKIVKEMDVIFKEVFSRPYETGKISETMPGWNLLYVTNKDDRRNTSPGPKVGTTIGQFINRKNDMISNRIDHSLNFGLSNNSCNIISHSCIICKSPILPNLFY